MGKYVIPLLILFIACLILGYCTTSGIPNSKPPSGPPINDPDQSKFRINLIMVDVKDLTKDTTDLLSVWGVFFKYQQEQLHGNCV